MYWDYIQLKNLNKIEIKGGTGSFDYEVTPDQIIKRNIGINYFPPRIIGIHPIDIGNYLLVVQDKMMIGN